MKTAYVNATFATGRGGLLVEDSKVVAAGPSVTRDTVGEAKVTDCEGKLVLPGLIDMRVFTGEPGSEYRETLLPPLRLRQQAE